ncbi:MAG: winged helix-turn-helix transcriptional regulator [Nanoarchaeota archaeon]|nr:winged helix-turn-helix transcriptional regulator [Nanoarchaeota archaeon]
MKKSKFLLLSLDDDRAKKIANTINNESGRKILDYLTENESTESEIAEKLNIPISTVHYNISQLLSAKLISWEKYHYSEKGKEVRHYTIANKYIVIAPKDEKESFAEKLKGLFSFFIFTILGAGFVFWFSNIGGVTSGSMMADSSIHENEAVMAKSMAYESAPMLVEDSFSQMSFFNEYSVYWFLIGVLFALIFYLLSEYFKRRKGM